MTVTSMFANVYKNRRVLVTGHTGFKGSWLTLWLNKLGANVCGFSLEPDTVPSHWEEIPQHCQSYIGDIRNVDKLNRVFNSFQPEIVFHLAAQPLVRRSYHDPIETFSTNVMGSVNVFEAARKTSSVCAVINVTTDKCYENREWVWGYRENDPMGGHDPYSASKGCSELVSASYRNSFGNDGLLIATARAGNVIGGGDWSEDRLIPDLIRAMVDKSPLMIRNPHATRPWQHVLEPLSGYLLLGQKLLEGNKEFAEAWNFGPSDSGNLTVGYVVEALQSYLDVEVNIDRSPQLHEASLLKLDCSKANAQLGWLPVWNASEMIENTALWYKDFYHKSELCTESQIESYVTSAENQRCVWTNK